MVKEDKIQLQKFRKGFPWIKIVSSASIGNGISVLSEKQMSDAVEYAATAQYDGLCKFVPASGAASRMFKAIYSGLETSNGTIEAFRASIKDFAFYDPSLFEGKDPAAVVLNDDGLGYGSQPKGVIRFHKYPSGETRTALAEHLVEGQLYARDGKGHSNIVFSISPEHLDLFEKALSEVKDEYEKRYNVKYDVSFVFQDKATDTIAVDLKNKPFLKEDGTVLRRPAGHGALIYNLDRIEQEVVILKNIDNVAVERYLPVTAEWKRILLGTCLELRDRIFGYLTALDLETGFGIGTFEPYPVLPGYSPMHYDACATRGCQDLCDEIEAFYKDELCVEIPAARDCESRVAALRKLLNRPVRVCGMVRNEGEPGGGPYIVKSKEGATSLQILEKAQINMEDAHSVEEFEKSTHFNPVDIVCCLHDYKGHKFNLLEFVDEDSGFISRKSYHGKEIKALELPGLWNGAMSNWNTAFVQVPAETFNPVKEVMDLRKEAHIA